ncbi:MAG: glucosylglycerol 3-phosphatase [Cyanobacteria bacterium J06621_8]
MSLSQQSLSTDYQALIDVLSNQENLLIIQDLDGVCMKLVKDPLTREMSPEYIKATTAFRDRFFVLTNGEHIGRRGVNSIVEKAFAGNIDLIKQQGLYLPGLAGGGVQLQDCYGNVSHPGVTEEELLFLTAVPGKIEASLNKFFTNNSYGLTSAEIEKCITVAILDNKVSPTANLNTFYDAFVHQPEVYFKLQKETAALMNQLLAEAAEQSLDDSFFIHYAPNLGRDEAGKEIMQLATDSDSGTTDFQFMLRGAIKEAGVLAILNHYYYLQTGAYPLGQEFNAREAAKTHDELLSIVKDNFDPDIMPQIIGVGDTVTSKAEVNGDQVIYRRGGSDRNFLQLIQDLNQYFNRDNIVAYIDSSGGEIKNRQALKLEDNEGKQSSDGKRNNADPLTLNIVFPGGYQQYVDIFNQAASLTFE